MHMLEANKHMTWIQLYVNMTDHICVIGVSPIFNTVFQSLPIFLMVLRYWVSPPQCPPHYLILFNPLTLLEAKECPLKRWSYFMR